MSDIPRTVTEAITAPALPLPEYVEIMVDGMIWARIMVPTYPATGITVRTVNGHPVEIVP